MNNKHPFFQYKSFDEFMTRANELKLKHCDYGNFVIFDYDQLESPRHSEADFYRGIVIDKNKMTIARSTMKRFYNIGEGEDVFDYSSFVVVDKEDGSFIGMWWNEYDSKWEVGTRFNPFGNNTLYKHIAFDDGLSEQQTTYRELFISYFGEDGFNNFTKELSKSCTYMFELCSPHNKVVHQYDDVEVYFIEIVNNTTGFEHIIDGIDNKPCSITTQECISEWASFHGLLSPKFFGMCKPDNPIKELKELTENLGNLREGFVIRDRNNNRLKVKSTAYLIAHRTKGHTLTKDDIVDLIRIGEHHEYVAVFPEYKEVFEKVKMQYDLLYVDILKSYEKYCMIESQKEFALSIKDLPYKSVLFDVRKYKIPLIEAFKKLKTEHIVKML